MDRAAVFVDAGYLFAAGARLLSNERITRTELHLHYEVLLELFTRLVQELASVPLLRIYWYDAAAGAPTAQQLALAYRPNLKLRLGSLNQQGQQKGVDSLLILDLVTLARNHAMSDALLVTGDEDIRVGVQQAQELGVRVHLVGVPPVRENQSGTLVQDADTLRELSLEEVRSFLRLTPVAASTSNWAAASGATEAGVDFATIAQQVAASLSDQEREDVRREAPAGSLPPLIDRRLLVAASNALNGAQLGPEQKRALRGAFVAALR